MGMALPDRVALVTGASSGIGAATARELGSRGAAVALLARRADRLREVAGEIDTETLVLPADVTDTTAVEAAVAAVEDDLGGLDVLVNNAGVALGGRLAEADLEELHRTVRVNLEGVMNVTHAALPALRADGGDVVTVSSLSARFPQETGGNAYTASKFGVNGFCRSVRKEMADEQVRVTVVMPGPVVTELNDWAHWDGRALQAEDVAETVAFVVSRPPRVELRTVSVDSTDKFE
jgi:hypothetical protein